MAKMGSGPALGAVGGPGGHRGAAGLVGGPGLQVGKEYRRISNSHGYLSRPHCVRGQLSNCR